MGPSAFAALLAYIISLLFALLLALALLLGARAKVPRFVALTLVVALTMLASFVAQFIAGSPASQEFAVRLSLITTSLIGPALAWFVGGTMPKANTKPLLVYSLFAPIFGLLSVLPTTHLNIAVSREGIAVTSDSFVYSAMLLVVFSTFAWCTIQIWAFEKKRNKLPRNISAYRSLRYAVSSALILNLVGALFLAQYTWSQMLSPISMVLMTYIMAIAIFRQRLLNVRHFVARAVAYILLYTTTITIFATTSLYLVNYLMPDKNRVQGPAIMVFSSVFLVLLAVQPFLKRFFDTVTNLIFYRVSYQPQQLLNDLNEKMVGEVDISKLASSMARILRHQLKLEFVAISLADQRYITSGKQAPTRAAASEIDSHLQTHHMSIVDIEQLTQHPKMELVVRLFEGSGIALVSEIHDGHNLLGRIYYGNKLSGEPFHSGDLELAEIVADQASLAVQNALKFEEIANFNNTLKEEVAHATYRLKHANERLKTLDELKDDFISMASHQFRTPAGSIRQALHMINDPNIDEKDRREMLKLAEANSEQLTTIVATMLSISRLQAGRFVLDKSLTDLSKLIDTVLGTTSILAEQKNITLHVDKPDDKVWLNIDAPKIKEAMTNYIENAIKYSPPGSKVAVTLKPNDRSVAFEVTDQGIGIPDENRKQLFGKFYRAPNARQQHPEGNGIGLYVVKSIAELHGGKVYYKPSVPGSTFGFTLPAPSNSSKRSKPVGEYKPLTQTATIIE